MKIAKQIIALIIVLLMVLSVFSVSTSAAEQSISYDAVKFNGHYYKVFPNGTVSSWEEAKVYCEELGGYLAVISSAEENEFLYSYITSLEISSAYFGLTDSESEGTWLWLKNEFSTYTNWNAGEPNNESGGEDYAEFYWKYTDGTWNDGDFMHNTVSDGNSFICEWASDITSTPSAPKVTASNTASNGKNKLTWNAVENAVSYRVYRAESKSGTYKLMKTTDSTSYVNSNAVAGKKYYYKVKAVSAMGKVSRYSSVVSRTCDLARPVVTTSNIASSGKVRLTWNPIDGAISYKVYRAESKSGTYKLMKTTTSTSYTNISATAGKTYYYKVKAVCSNSAADSAYSSVKTRTCDLAKPTNVMLYFNNKNKPVITWSEVEGAVSYRVYRAASENGTYTLMKTTSSTSYTNTSITHGATYYYKVKAICSNSAADSVCSETVNGYIK